MAALDMRDALPVEAEGLAKTYTSRQHGSVEALRQFDLRLEPGEVLGLIGPNGSGKTTALQVLLGLVRADRGRVRLFGLSPIDRRARARLGYLPEDTALLPFLTAEETLHLTGRLHGLERHDRRRRAATLLDELGLAAVRRRRVATFSRGMARRLAFGQAVFHAPRLLVLDEPTAGLDPEGSDLVFEMVRRRRRDGTAVLLTTHVLAEAEEHCSRVGILLDGRVVRAGTLEELLGREARRREVSGLERLFRRLLDGEDA